MFGDVYSLHQRPVPASQWLRCLEKVDCLAPGRPAAGRAFATAPARRLHPTTPQHSRTWRHLASQRGKKSTGFGHRKVEEGVVKPCHRALNSSNAKPMPRRKCCCSASSHGCGWRCMECKTSHGRGHGKTAAFHTCTCMTGRHMQQPPAIYAGAREDCAPHARGIWHSPTNVAFSVKGESQEINFRYAKHRPVSPRGNLAASTWFLGLIGYGRLPSRLHKAIR